MYEVSGVYSSQDELKIALCMGPKRFRNFRETGPRACPEFSGS